ncbi:UDP-3-O-(3-hydroxymyristoyl)glucosamine N-acyltransferase [Colwellia sp. Arc7-635]|uniref:UDP-3-O-(3-hydroxymyristoyl)glucosamine N-acyltransferase n=1 Tax=Colwellia sp. Arc7-635 TaxID=2497879 RepID=UPI000F85487D|nr:UDP-3-O-(3-hydroxymyristoyl)glucosamine N-acyltransferase [Colwellia sp. Arc7-635]AZQ84093.1 UDP-3-O-(3-hydroxymyristoyl)glucosamine N-acyltransferase [Colwellia sp. Arc7-635]
MTYILADIAKKIGAVVQGDEQCEISSIATLTAATSGQIAFLANSKYSAQLSTTNASAIIVTKADADKCQTNALVMDNPYMGYALVAQLLDSTPKPAKNIHASAVIAEGVTLGKGVSIGANAVIETGVELADGVSIGAGSFIGIAAQIGINTTIWSNVSIYHGVVIGENCLVHANTVIGADGFGYANNKGSWVKIPQLGSVIIGDNVEIGASTTIDRGALGDTIIKDGVILDNQIQIAHNVIIGENTAIAACSVIAGSTEIGKNCIIAGLVGINGHIKITDGCVFTGMTMVTKAIAKPGVYSSGMPCQPNKDWHKNNARIRKLESLTKRLSIVEKELALKS